MKYIYILTDKVNLDDFRLKVRYLPLILTIWKKIFTFLQVAYYNMKLCQKIFLSKQS